MKRFAQRAMIDPIVIGNSAPSGGSSGGGASGEEWIGDGNTHLWISLPEGRTAPMLGVCPKGTVTVDWGDGSTPDVLTGTSTSAVKRTPNHEYGKAGDYVITLTVDGEMGFVGQNGTGSYVLRYSSSSDNRDFVYQRVLKRVEIGDCVKIGQYAFNKCYALASINIPDSVTSIDTSAFALCSCLPSITIPNSVTNIGGSAFLGCSALTSINIPDSVTSIGSSAFSQCNGLTRVNVPNSVTDVQATVFSYCYGLAVYDFTNDTAVPTLANTNAFSGIPADCEIRVPAALYEEWIAATNWSTYASQIVGV